MAVVNIPLTLSRTSSWYEWNSSLGTWTTYPLTVADHTPFRTNPEGMATSWTENGGHDDPILVAGSSFETFGFVTRGETISLVPTAPIPAGVVYAELNFSAAISYSESGPDVGLYPLQIFFTFDRTDNLAGSSGQVLWRFQRASSFGGVTIDPTGGPPLANPYVLSGTGPFGGSVYGDADFASFPTATPGPGAPSLLMMTVRPVSIGRTADVGQPPLWSVAWTITDLEASITFYTVRRGRRGLGLIRG